MSFGVIDVLRLAGLNPSLRTKILRHQEADYPVEELLAKDCLELYQSYQGKPRFHATDQILTFYGLRGNRAGFYGAYSVKGHKPAREGLTIPSLPWSVEWQRKTQYFYDLRPIHRFDFLRDRLIIKWSGRHWAQRLTNMSILEIKAPGRKLVAFRDYLEFSLTHAELKYLFAHEEAHGDWKSALTAVGGVYMVLDQDTGHQYVGSAYGTAGIWGRWKSYANSGHGGNVKLRDLMNSKTGYPDKFRFSILQILPRTLASKEVIARECGYKEKLGTRATGLNS